MPRINHTPSYRRHKRSGQAVVTLCGKDHYLGKWNSKESKEKYDRLIGEWLASDRGLPRAKDRLTVIELVARFWKHAQKHYRKNGNPTGAAENFKVPLKILKEVYGSTLADDFGPLALKALRHRFIEQGHARSYVNDNVAGIRKVFKWGVGEEIVSAVVVEKLNTVEALEEGRSDAKEPDPIGPVSQEEVDAVLPHLPPAVYDMVRVQLLTGARPKEVCDMRPCDIDQTEATWRYVPASHKTQHHGKRRVVLIGPQAQAILAGYLLEREPEEYLFSPKSSEKLRHIDMRRRRKSPVQPSQQGGARRARKPKRPPRDHYDTAAYRRAIHRACDLAFPAPEPLCRRDDESVGEWQERLTVKQQAELDQWRSDHRWSPNRLRHSAGTKVRKGYGIEVASTVLGHSKLDTSEIYAERNLEVAAGVIAKIG